MLHAAADVNKVSFIASVTQQMLHHVDLKFTIRTWLIFQALHKCALYDRYVYIL